MPRSAPRPATASPATRWQLQRHDYAAVELMEDVHVAGNELGIGTLGKSRMHSHGANCIPGVDSGSDQARVAEVSATRLPGNHEALGILFVELLGRPFQQ